MLLLCLYISTGPVSLTSPSLSQAASEPKESIERHLKVAAFALSFCQGNVRPSKPVPPMRGETLEMIDERQGFRVVVEEVTAPVTVADSEAKLQLQWLEGGWRKSPNVGSLAICCARGGL